MGDLHVLPPGEAAPEPAIPKFEGREVNGTQIRISGAMPLENLDHLVLGVDDWVHLEGDYRVVSVRHYADPKTGDLIREQVLRPMKADIKPWDPTDPKDDGVLRKIEPDR